MAYVSPWLMSATDCSRRPATLHARLPKQHNFICVAGIALSVLLLNAQVYWLGMNVYQANFIAIVLVSVWNFFLNLKFGWKLEYFTAAREEFRRLQFGNLRM